MNVRKRRRLVIVLTAVGITLTAMIAHRGVTMVRSQRAVAEWQRIGGAIGVQMNARLGPENMSLGSMPGVPFVNKATIVRDAAVKMNRDAGCRYLHLSQLGWSCAELTSVVSVLDLDYLGLDRMVDGDECIDLLIKRENIRSFGFGGTGPSYDGLRSILCRQNVTLVRVSGVRLTDHECAELRTEFGSRISIE